MKPLEKKPHKATWSLKHKSLNKLPCPDHLQPNLILLHEEVKIITENCSTDFCDSHRLDFRTLCEERMEGYIKNGIVMYRIVGYSKDVYYVQCYLEIIWT